MIDYETFVEIKVYQTSTALMPSDRRELDLDYRTVAKWLDEKPYRPRKPVPRASKLDPFKGQIVRCLRPIPIRRCRSSSG